MKIKNLLLSLFVIGMLFIVGCGGNNYGTTSQKVPAPGYEGVDEMVVASGGEVKVIDIVAKQWSFDPDTIEVNLGDQVLLHIESIDVTHGFAIPEFGINERLRPQEDIHIEFVADKKGSFGFFCSIPCGSGHGKMKGQIIVN